MADWAFSIDHSQATRTCQPCGCSSIPNAWPPLSSLWSPGTNECLHCVANCARSSTSRPLEHTIVAWQLEPLLRPARVISDRPQPRALAMRPPSGSRVEPFVLYHPCRVQPSRVKPKQNGLDTGRSGYGQREPPIQECQPQKLSLKLATHIWQAEAMNIYVMPSQPETLHYPSRYHRQHILREDIIEAFLSAKLGFRIH